MTKVTMSRAVGVVSRDTSQADMDAELPEGTPLITTTQAEAYATARVREALKEAANIAGSAFRRSRAAYCSGGEPYTQGAADCAGFIETDIRVLISKQ